MIRNDDFERLGSRPLAKTLIKERLRDFALQPLNLAYLLTLRWASGFILEFHSTWPAPGNVDAIELEV